MKKPHLLCILDGFGLSPNKEGNAVYQAKTPNFDRLFQECASTSLFAHGQYVGLPEGQMGNSEVGHLNIGAGRIVKQWLVRITEDLQNSFLKDSKDYNNFIKGDIKRIHLIGLMSSGGVHSHQNHLDLLIEELKKDFDGDLIIHLITDGRDTAPDIGLPDVRSFEEKYAKDQQVHIATVSGRFYPMDRDSRWEKTKLAYDAIALGKGHLTDKASHWIKESYESGTTDEFIEPAVVDKLPYQDGDGFIFWNFRADRMRQIVSALCLDEFQGFDREHSLPDKENVLCMTEYNSQFKLPFLFSPIPIENYLGSFLEKLNKTQYRIAETEKYPHVTYFLNGGTEETAEGEDREMIPSTREVKTYNLKPEMSAKEIEEALIKALDSQRYDLLVVNFANPDMVGHSGELPATITACETVDICLGKVMDKIEELNGKAVIIADHGNAEIMINEDGSPHTAHTTSPVPCIIYGIPPETNLANGGSLGNIAPTMLKLMDIEQPEEMTEKPLF